MQPVKYLLVFAILLASCRSSRTAMAPATTEITNDHVLVAGIHAPTPAPIENTFSENTNEQTFTPVENTNTASPEITGTVVAKAAKQQVRSFAQFKTMAANNEIVMSKRDMKTLNKIEKHYKGDYQKFRSDVFEFTTKAKIIAGIGLLGLLLAIFAGSGFGLFLFILALLAFILRYLNVIAF